MSYLLFLHAGRGGGAVGNPSVMLQSHDEDLHSLLHQLLPVVREEQVVVRDAVAHRIICAHHIQQRGEQRQSVSGDERHVDLVSFVRFKAVSECTKIVQEVAVFPVPDVCTELVKKDN